VRNQTLSLSRAQRVRTFLVTLGVPAADLTAKGFGSSQPVTDNNGAELPDKSRRVVFGVTSR
jgi:OmpA-OmpF porin, OOP family